MLFWKLKAVFLAFTRMWLHFKGDYIDLFLWPGNFDPELSPFECSWCLKEQTPIFLHFLIIDCRERSFLLNIRDRTMDSTVICGKCRSVQRIKCCIRTSQIFRIFAKIFDFSPLDIGVFWYIWQDLQLASPRILQYTQIVIGRSSFQPPHNPEIFVDKFLILLLSNSHIQWFHSFKINLLSYH